MVCNLLKIKCRNEDPKLLLVSVSELLDYFCFVFIALYPYAKLHEEFLKYYALQHIEDGV